MLKHPYVTCQNLCPVVPCVRRHDTEGIKMVSCSPRTSIKKNLSLGPIQSPGKALTLAIYTKRWTNVDGHGAKTLKFSLSGSDQNILFKI